jgi:hypothetical protein
MKNNGVSKPVFILAVIVFALWLIINLRVEAGVGSIFERTVDGLVAGVVLLVAVFLTLRFYQGNRKE